MLARCVSVAFQGVEARRVEVEAQLTGGEVKFYIVGLGDKAVTELADSMPISRPTIQPNVPPAPAPAIAARMGPADTSGPNAVTVTG